MFSEISVIVKKVSNSGIVCEATDGKQFAVMSSKLQKAIEDYAIGDSLLLVFDNEILISCHSADSTEQTVQSLQAEKKAKIQLTCKPILNGIMAYWKGLDEAVRYIVTLYINDDDIATRICERTEKYCAFMGLAAGKDFVYAVEVSAESRTGDILATSMRVKTCPSDVVKVNVEKGKIDANITNHSIKVFSGF